MPPPSQQQVSQSQIEQYELYVLEYDNHVLISTLSKCCPILFCTGEATETDHPNRDG